MEKPVQRIAAIDNLRAIMIFFVVAGHLMEFVFFEHSVEIYDVIYTFHMPVFAFLSGLCCKNDSIFGKQLWKNAVWPYMVFQLLYLLTSNIIWNVELPYQFTQPYWILWYLVAIFNWRIMLMMTQAAKRKWTPMLISIAAALLVGYDASIGYFLSISRSIVLFPFFYAGFMARSHQEKFEKFLFEKIKRLWIMRAAAVILGAILTIFTMRRADAISSEILWHAYTYSDAVGNAIDRAMVLVLGAMWLAIFAIITPRREIPLLTHIGRNTMPVFLWHGFLMKGLKYNHAWWENLPAFPFFLIILVLTPIIFSLKPVVFLSKPFLRCPFGRD